MAGIVIDEVFEVSSIVEACEQTRQRHGELNKHVLLEDATDTAHPLHQHFEWDNAKAGHAHRLGQAQQLLRMVRFVDTRTEDQKSQRWYRTVRVVGSSQPDYRPVTLISQQPLTRAQVQARFDADVQALRTKYQALVEWFDFDQAMREQFGPPPENAAS